MMLRPRRQAALRNTFLQFDSDDSDAAGYGIEPLNLNPDGKEGGDTYLTASGREILWSENDDDEVDDPTYYTTVPSLRKAEGSKPRKRGRKKRNFSLTPKSPILNNAESLEPKSRRKKEKVNRTDADGLPNLDLMCKECGKFYVTKKHVELHMQRIHLEKKYVCTVVGCNKKYGIEKDLRLHIDNYHCTIKPKKMVACPHEGCTSTFTSRGRLKLHINIHSDERPFLCLHCGRRFRRSDNLKVHERQHTGEKPIKCSFCDFSCRQKASLNYHMQKYHPEIEVKIVEQKMSNMIGEQLESEQDDDDDDHANEYMSESTSQEESNISQPHKDIKVENDAIKDHNADSLTAWLEESSSSSEEIKFERPEIIQDGMKGCTNQMISSSRLLTMHDEHIKKNIASRTDFRNMNFEPDLALMNSFNHLQNRLAD